MREPTKNKENEDDLRTQGIARPIKIRGKWFETSWIEADRHVFGNIFFGKLEQEYQRPNPEKAAAGCTPYDWARLPEIDVAWYVDVPPEGTWWTPPPHRVHPITGKEFYPAWRGRPHIIRFADGRPAFVTQYDVGLGLVRHMFENRVEAWRFFIKSAGDAFDQQLATMQKADPNCDPVTEFLALVFPLMDVEPLRRHEWSRLTTADHR